jgi:hypothetical protein
MAEDPQDWTGIHERLDTRALRERLEAAGLSGLALWSHKISLDEAAPAVAAHLGRLLAGLALALRESDEQAWLGVLQEFSHLLEQVGEPLNMLSDEIPIPPFKQLLEVQAPSADTVGTLITWYWMRHIMPLPAVISRY